MPASTDCTFNKKGSSSLDNCNTHHGLPTTPTRPTPRRKKSMNCPKTPAAGPAPRSASGESSYKRTVTVVATFALATAFALAAAPAATASTNNHIPSASAVAPLDDPPGPGQCGEYCWPGWFPGHKRWNRPTPSASTGAASSDLATPPSHYGPLCPDFPGTCPPDKPLRKRA